MKSSDELCVKRANLYMAPGQGLLGEPGTSKKDRNFTLGLHLRNVTGMFGTKIFIFTAHGNSSSLHVMTLVGRNASSGQDLMIKIRFQDDAKNFRANFTSCEFGKDSTRDLGGLAPCHIAAGEDAFEKVLRSTFLLVEDEHGLAPNSRGTIAYRPVIFASTISSAILIILLAVAEYTSDRKHRVVGKLIDILICRAATGLSRGSTEPSSRSGIIQAGLQLRQTTRALDRDGWIQSTKEEQHRLKLEEMHQLSQEERRERLDDVRRELTN